MGQADHKKYYMLKKHEKKQTIQQSKQQLFLTILYD